MQLISILAPIIGYLCGSIPFGLLLTRAAGLGDVRSIGSGNIGATNVLRTGNKGLAAATLVLDALKGTIPALVFARYGTEAGALAGAGASSDTSSRSGLASRAAKVLPPISAS